MKSYVSSLQRCSGKVVTFKGALEFLSHRSDTLNYYFKHDDRHWLSEIGQTWHCCYFNLNVLVTAEVLIKLVYR